MLAYSKHLLFPFLLLLVLLLISMLHFLFTLCTSWHECGSFHYGDEGFISLYLSLSLSDHSLPTPPSLLLHSQVHLLRTAGDEVTITVRYLREVPSFLKLPLGKNRSVCSHANNSQAAIKGSKANQGGEILFKLVCQRGSANEHSLQSVTAEVSHPPPEAAVFHCCSYFWQLRELKLFVLS